MFIVLACPTTEESDNTDRIVRVEDIARIEGKGNTTDVILKDGTKFTCIYSVDTIRKMYGKKLFGD